MKHKNTTAHSIIWKEFNSNSPQGRHLGAEQDFALPYLNMGEVKEIFEEGNLQDLKEINLLMGILVGYKETPPAVDIIYSKSFFPKVLEDLKVHFGFDSMERMIVDIASYIRREIGDYISVLALITGTEILPDNSRIKFDCCVDLYNLLERNEYVNRAIGLSMLKLNLSNIDEFEINNDLVNHLGTFKDFLKTY